MNAPIETTGDRFAVITELGTLGNIHRKTSGPHAGLWFFVPMVSGRRGNRIGAATAEAAIPRWAKKRGGKIV